ncbi:SCP2 sterol-binding domain-containing protein [Plantactinospora sp. KBS50]|uniref:SCP2 sterol-binding domain-containing protein n=1 Tax=Plantactinospora sp. KBS50 TaxID=2024580 RepID=UPI0012FD0AA6|nr:SCP2 sterol-binding domain-containing protein [Plantactinospora sp. KBS50]
MTDPIAAFFARLDATAPPVPPKYHGSVRFDLAGDDGTEHWGLIFDNGRVRLFRSDQDADCVVRTSRQLFEGLTSGQGGIYAALLRNRISVEGDLTLLTAIRMLLPGPPSAHHPVEWARSHRLRRDGEAQREPAMASRAESAGPARPAGPAGPAGPASPPAATERWIP